LPDQFLPADHAGRRRFGEELRAADNWIIVARISPYRR
jgi:hypothetical protein